MLEGRIVKALSGYYYVKANGRLWQCRARGLFKKKQLSPLVGDWVRLTVTENEEGYIQEIAPRKTVLSRPPMANADQAVIVSSLRQPDFQSLLIDKILIHVEEAGMEPVVVLTKTDLGPLIPEAERALEAYRAIGYPVVMSSVVNRRGLEELAQLLSGRVSVFAGQSGTGKSSLLNALIPDKQLATAGVSRKLGRGRHTTRHVELFELPAGGLVADTPGFSQLSLTGWTEEQLEQRFPDIAGFARNCKFRGCQHDREPHCAVKDAVASKGLYAKRYEHYVQFLNEIREQRRY